MDVPAIEGLNSKKRDDGVSYFHFVDNKEKKVIDINHPDWIAAATYAQAVQDWTKAANYAQALVDWGRSAEYAQWVKEAQFAQACLDAGFSNVINGSFGALPPSGSTHNYRLEGGRVTSDVVEVQGTLDRLLTENASLKQFKAESITSFRTDYIKGLVKAGKLAAPQEEQLIGLVNGLTEEQFTAFRVSYDAAPSASLFAPYGSSVEEDDADKISEKDECEQILASHRASGMNEESIKNTSSYKKLSKLDPAAAEKFVS